MISLMATVLLNGMMVVSSVESFLKVNLKKVFICGVLAIFTPVNFQKMDNVVVKAFY
jgi:hypothetical protein